MKMTSFIIGAVLSAILAGCTSAPVVLAPVGPNPTGFRNSTPAGQLEVFSALTSRIEGDNPTWYQHTDYYICNLQGKRLKSVFNTTGYYAQSPRSITLPAGTYIVKAQAKGHVWVEVPVVIDAGRIPRIHLDAQWQPPAGTPQTELVNASVGYPIGWRPELARESGIN
jgi:hypothetical protein